MSDPLPSAETILAAALGIGDPAERRAYLDGACAGGAALRAEVESLLEANAVAGEFLLHPPPIGASAAQKTMFIPSLPELTGTRIGRYKLLEPIGEGGFGVVWMAEQEEPVRRRVALKIIKPGMDTKEVVARFEAERQALAMMDHSNIASVFDGGATDTGRPYFVMELVKGIPITQFCDERKLSTRERLELFMQVCQAVQHAHQKGVIHRDLKPSNILVTVKDDRPVPKVIDFGIAKATQARLTEKTIFTRFNQWIGTPAYMSPEQAGLGSLDVDTRSDIYSLGVLLYELLTGRTPFDTQKLMEAGYDAVMRTIREEEPPKPSTRLSTLNLEELSAVATKRGAEPAKLGRLVRGDLDWIVMKAIEKDRQRRYETAAGLEKDLGRYLRNEPVTAAAPTLPYRISKFVRRHRTGLAMGAALLVLLVAGTVVSTIEAVRATRAERAQKALREQAELGQANEAQLHREAETSRKQAQAESSKSRQVSQFLAEMLRGVGPSVALGRDTTLLREVLDKTAARVGTDLTNQPEIEAELSSTLSAVYRALADYAVAERMERRALDLRRELWGEEHLEVARSLNNLAQLLCQQGKYGGAVDVGSQALAMRRKLLGNEHREVADSLRTLGVVFHSQGRLEEAVAVFGEALRLHGDLDSDLESAATLASLGRALESQGRSAEAETLLRTALAVQQQVLPSEHPAVANTLNHLGNVLSSQGKLAEGEAVQRQGLAMAQHLYRHPHPAIAGAHVGLVRALQRQGKTGAIEELLREELAKAGDSVKRPQERADGIYLTLDALLAQRDFQLADRLLSEELSSVITNRSQNTWLLFDRATLSARRSRFAQAATDFAAVISRDPTDHDAWYRLAVVLAQSGDADAYRGHCRQMLALRQHTTEPTIAETAAKASLLLPSDTADLEAAARFADLAIQIGTNHPFLPYLQLAKGLAEYRRGHYPLAQDWVRRALAHGWTNGNLRGPGLLVLAMAHQQLGQNAEAQNAFERARAAIQTGWPPASDGDLGGDWFDLLIAEVLSREAETLILTGRR